MSVKLCDKLTWCSKTVIFSTKLNQFVPNFYSCGLSTAPIEYSCLSVCVSVCVCVCVCVSVYTITQNNNGSIHLKLEHIVVYENSLDKFSIGHCQIKVKVTALFSIYHNTNCQVHISALAHVRKL